MAEKNIGDFIYDDTQPMEETFKQYAGFVTKNTKDSLRKEVKDELQKEFDAQKVKNDFIASIQNKENQKVVSRLIKSGVTVEEIKTDFSNLITPEVKEITKGKLSQENPDIRTTDILKEISESTKTNVEDLNKLLATPTEKWSELNNNDLNKLIQIDVARKNKNKTK